MPTIYVNGRFLSQKMTGQQRFSRELLAGFDRWLDEDAENRAALRFVVLAPPGAPTDLGTRHVEVREVGSLQGHLWDQIDLPRHALGGVLLSMCGTGPLLHPRHVITIHDAAPFANPENFTRKFRAVYSVLVPLLAKAARRVVTVSEFSKAELVRYCGIAAGKIDVVGNGGDHILRAPSDASVLAEYGLDGRRYVFAVGSNSVNKNFGLVVEAFNRLQRDDLVLAVAGGQNSSVFAACPVRDTANVVRLGYVSDGALRALYENAMCFVLPSLYEGFGIPPVEAMLCGCPVIVSNAAALVETSGDGALICDPHDPDGLASQITSLADDAVLHAEMRSRGLARGRRFTWDASSRTMIGVLQGLGRRATVAPATSPA